MKRTRKEFKVGDKVTDVILDKKGKIITIENLITVEFEDSSCETYTIDGCYLLGQKQRLYHGHNVIIQVVGEELPEEKMLVFSPVNYKEAGKFIGKKVRCSDNYLELFDTTSKEGKLNSIEESEYAFNVNEYWYRYILITE